ncbi:MAG: symmetrical bis(5'-nucleosyl)-tetraphosphatase [Proteobacteria bacterium]|nr:symmetrical bis(5'-nucleosyl)-tetraphosphatase [Pseudomonadota bacterium]
MPTYAIGDVQGCYHPLLQLLEKINYNPAQDALWFTGDLVNRGYHSLETIRFIKALPQKTKIVLGNHDLALLAYANGSIKPHPKDTFDEILQAPDAQDLLSWLKHLPLLHHDATLGFTLTHAGIYPLWDLVTAQNLAKEIEDLLQGPQSKVFFDHLFGNTPTAWDEKLTGWERARFIVNAFTRMRFCTSDGHLDLKANGSPAMHPELIPWFAFKERKLKSQNLIFGHWAALFGSPTTEHVIALDSGCVWGNCLTAFCLENKQSVSVDCKDYITTVK